MIRSELKAMVGKRIVLRTYQPYQDILKLGDTGTVLECTIFDTLLVDWDCGYTCAVLPNIIDLLPDKKFLQFETTYIRKDDAYE